MKTRMTFAMYVPKDGKAAELMAIVERHVPTLKEFGLITNRDNYVARASDGTIIEVFEWVSEDAKDAAHEHPAIAEIWEQMTPLCEFGHMQNLKEAKYPFPNFHVLD